MAAGVGLTEAQHAQLVLNIWVGLHLGEISLGAVEQSACLIGAPQPKIHIGKIHAAEVALPHHGGLVGKQGVEAQEVFQRFVVVVAHVVIMPSVVEVVEAVFGRHAAPCGGGAAPPALAAVEVHEVGIDRRYAYVSRCLDAVVEAGGVGNLYGAAVAVGGHVEHAVVAVSFGEVEVGVRFHFGLLYVGEEVECPAAVEDVGVGHECEAHEVACSERVHFAVKEHAAASAGKLRQIAFDGVEAAHHFGRTCRIVVNHSQLQHCVVVVVGITPGNGTLYLAAHQGHGAVGPAGDDLLRHAVAQQLIVAVGRVGLVARRKHAEGRKRRNQRRKVVQFAFHLLSR